ERVSYRISTIINPRRPVETRSPPPDYWTAESHRVKHDMRVSGSLLRQSTADSFSLTRNALKTLPSAPKQKKRLNPCPFLKITLERF
ncbi:hypothetical protein, partial [Escherichia coli]|uniref:hypothetical protein n=1 Tax=Escherichia coli TaxID=562 RepID=UPI001F5B633D